METTINRRDPKLWPTALKFATLLNISAFVALGNFHAAGLTTGFGELAEEFHVGYGQLANQVSYPVLAQGLANLIWMPTALCIGKRPVILFTIAMLLAGCAWGSVAGSLNSLLASRIFTCVGSGSVESIGPSMIADMFFEKNFAFAMAFFALALTFGSQIGPLIAGYLIQDKGWRWLFILLSILTAVNLVCAFLFLPETSYKRVWYEGETAADVDKIAVQQEEYSGKEAQSSHVEVHNHVAKSYGTGYWRDLWRPKVAGAEYHGPKFWLYQAFLPFRFLVIPSVLFAAIAYGIALGWNVIISTLAPQLFSPPPYNFTSASLGLFGLAGFVGILIAFPFAGPLTDALSAFLRKRNVRRGTGIDETGHKPEHRLPALVLPFLICAPGLILFAYSYIPVSQYGASLNPHSGIHMPAKPWLHPAIGYAMAASGLALVPSVMLSYVVDAYPQTSGEALVLINATKNVIAFGLTKASANWLASAGIKTMFLTMSGIEWGVLLLALPLYIAGPWLRKITVKWL